MGEIIPPIDQAVELEREELAIFLLRYLADARLNMMNLNSFLLGFGLMVMPEKQGALEQEIERGLTEAWLWLERGHACSANDERIDVYHAART